MELQNLTKKNQEFIKIAHHQLLQDGKSEAEIKEILDSVLPAIEDNQKKGIPARNFLGAPTSWAASFTEKPEEKITDPNQSKDTTPWKMILDTSLFLLGLLAVVNGGLRLINPSQVTYGLITLLLMCVAGGILMYGMYHYIYRHMHKSKDERPGLLKSWGIMLVLVLAWLAVVALASLLPTSINPELPAFLLLLIGAIALVGRYYFKKKYNIENALAPQTRP